jgi:hypothetical protein
MSDPDERFEDALLGAPPLSPEDDLGAFVRDVRDAYPTGPLLAEEAHVEAVAATARTISERDRRPERKESHVRIPRLRSRAALIVTGLVVAMSSFGGLAVAGALPDGVQNGVANVVSAVGVQLPDGSDDQVEDDGAEVEEDATEGEAPDTDESEAPEPRETESPDGDAQGEKVDDQVDDGESAADDQGEDEQSGAQGGDQESEAEDQDEDEQSGDQAAAGDQGEQSDDGGEEGGGENGGGED